MADAPAPILLLCRDLMFVSKVTATARALGVAVQVIRDPAQLPQQGGRLLVDLNQPGAIEAASALEIATAGEGIRFLFPLRNPNVDQTPAPRPHPGLPPN